MVHRLGPDDPSALALADLHDAAMTSRKDGGHLAPPAVSPSHRYTDGPALTPHFLRPRHVAESYQSRSVLGRLFDLVQELLCDVSIDTVIPTTLEMDPDMREPGAGDFLQLAQRIYKRCVALVC